LFEEEGDFGLGALVADGARPFGVHTTGAVAALATDDYPADTAQVEIERAEEGLTGEEADGGFDATQVIDASGPTLVFDRDADPDVVRDVEPTGQRGEAFGALCQYLIGMPFGLAHDVEDLKDVGVRYGFVKEVAHAVHKDQAWALPLKGLSESFGAQGWCEPDLVGVTGDASEALGEGLRVAVGASGRDLGAAGNRVPGGFGPFDVAVVAHRTLVLILTLDDCQQLTAGSASNSLTKMSFGTLRFAQSDNSKP